MYFPHWIPHRSQKASPHLYNAHIQATNTLTVVKNIVDPLDKQWQVLELVMHFNILQLLLVDILIKYFIQILQRQFYRNYKTRTTKHLLQTTSCRPLQQYILYSYMLNEKKSNLSLEILSVCDDGDSITSLGYLLQFIYQGIKIRESQNH